VLRADKGEDVYHKKFPRIANIPRRLLTFGPKGREEQKCYQRKTKQTVDDLSNFSKAIRCWTSSIVKAVCYGNHRHWTIETAKSGTKEVPCSQTNCLIVSGISLLKTQRV
jgi:hypothetical protein